MFFIDLLIVLVLAVLFTAILGFGFRWRHPAREEGWPGIVFVFTILFLFMWAGGGWIYPGGPVLWGAPWLSFLLIGLFITLLIAALAPSPPPRDRTEVVLETPEERKAGIVFGMIFWILLIGLIVVAVLRYM